MNNIYVWKVCPGSYNISTDLKWKSPVYHNSPKSLFSKGKKFPDVFISTTHNKEKMLVDSPPANLYYPNIDNLYEKSKVYTFGSTVRTNNFSATAVSLYKPEKIESQFISSMTSFKSKAYSHSSFNHSRKFIKKSSKRKVDNKIKENSGFIDTRKLFYSKR